MNDTEIAALMGALQKVAVTGLNALVAHNVKFAKKLKNGIDNIEAFYEKYHIELKAILEVLSHTFGFVEEWLEKAIPALVPIFNLAKELWQDYLTGTAAAA